MRIACLWIPAWSTEGVSPPVRPGSATPRASSVSAPTRRSGRRGSKVSSRVFNQVSAPVSNPLAEPDSPERAKLEATLLEVVPRLRIEARGRIWADIRGLDARRCVEGLCARLAEAGWPEVVAGVSALPVTAFVASSLQLPASGQNLEARSSKLEAPLHFVPVGAERSWLADHPLTVLEPDDSLRTLLEGVGIERCGQLAELARESVEVRFGAEGVALWRLARAEDARVLFGTPVGDRPGGSIDFVDYVVTDPARLLFTANALLTPVCEKLRVRGHHARRIRLRLGLANGQEWRRSLRAARPTASRERWLGMIRGELERLTVPDAVAAVHLEVEATEEAEARQGDLFDRGFATAGAVEAAIARLVEEQGPVVLTPSMSGHPLAERRTEWVDFDEQGHGAMGRWGDVRVGPPHGPEAPTPDGRIASTPHGPASVQSALTLQLHPEPLPIEVETAARRDHELPARYRERRGNWRPLVEAAGPDRLSGGQWEGGYAREYFRCVADDGALVWMFREPREQRWYLHGWWE